MGAFNSQVKGVDEITRQLEKFRGDLEECIAPVANELEEYTYLMVGEQYDSEGRIGPKGVAWSRKQSTIDAYTKANRRGAGYINQDMRRTDALRTSETRRGAPHQIREVTANSFMVGTDLSYGAIQQGRGQTQYDPAEKNIKVYAGIIVRGRKGKALSRHFIYEERTSPIPF